jgi:hypothetical protein
MVSKRLARTNGEHEARGDWISATTSQTPQIPFPCQDDPAGQSWTQPTLLGGGHRIDDGPALFHARLSLRRGRGPWYPRLP